MKAAGDNCLFHILQVKIEYKAFFLVADKCILHIVLLRRSQRRKCRMIENLSSLIIKCIHADFSDI